MKLPVLSCLLACALALPARAQSPVFTEQAVFVSGADGYHSFRIPAIVCAKNGDLLAFAEGRVASRNDHDDVDIVLKRSTDHGATWGPMQVLQGAQDHGLITWGNPCPVVDRHTGRVWLTTSWENYRVHAAYSDDHGVTWSAARDITAEVWSPAWPRPPAPILAIWTGPGNGIQMEHGPHAGRLLIPVHLRRHPLRKSEQNEATCFYSDDHGKSWHYSETTTGFGNEAQVVELSDGRLMLNQRHQLAVADRTPGVPRYRLVSYSADGGANWSPSKPDDELIDPTVQASILRYAWGETAGGSKKGVVLFANPAHLTLRSHMTVRASFDDGDSWPVQRVVRESPSSYSCLVRQADGMIGLFYEIDRSARIMYARFNLAWLKETPARPTSPAAGKTGR